MESNAAARVFETAELLEMILFEHGLDSLGIAEYNFREHLPLQDSPLQELFRLQRVNKTVRATIVNSRKLRHLMFLEPISDIWHTEDKHPRDPYRNHFVTDDIAKPIEFIFHLLCKGYMDLDRNYSPNAYTVRLPRHSVDQDDFARLRAHIAKLKTSDATHVDASWRLCRALRMGQETVTLEQRIFVPGHAGIWNERHDPTGEYTRKFVVDAETTLGQVWDWYERIVSMTDLEHQQAWTWFWTAVDDSTRDCFRYAYEWIEWQKGGER